MNEFPLLASKDIEDFKSLSRTLALKRKALQHSIGSVARSKWEAIGRRLSQATGVEVEAELDRTTFFRVPDDVAELPWELLPFRGEPVGLAVPVQRLAGECDSNLDELELPDKLCSLRVFTEKPDPPLDGLEREERSLRKNIGGHPRIALLDWYPRDEIPALREKILKCHAIHFGGHAERREDGNFYFQVCGTPEEWVRFDELFAGDIQQAPLLVYLNVCGYGHGLAHDLLAAGCRNVVAFDHQVTDAVAENVLPNFYRKLASGGTVAKAVWEIRRILADRCDPDWISCIAYGPGEALFKKASPLD